MTLVRFDGTVVPWGDRDDDDDEDLWRMGGPPPPDDESESESDDDGQSKTDVEKQSDDMATDRRYGMTVAGAPTKHGGRRGTRCSARGGASKARGGASQARGGATNARGVQLHPSYRIWAVSEERLKMAEAFLEY